MFVKVISTTQIGRRATFVAENGYSARARAMSRREYLEGMVPILIQGFFCVALFVLSFGHGLNVRGDMDAMVFIVAGLCCFALLIGWWVGTRNGNGLTFFPWKEISLMIIVSAYFHEVVAHGFGSFVAGINTFHTLVFFVWFAVIYGRYVYYWRSREIWEPLFTTTIFCGTVIIVSIALSRVDPARLVIFLRFMEIMLVLPLITNLLHAGVLWQNWTCYKGISTANFPPAHLFTDPPKGE